MKRDLTVLDAVLRAGSVEETLAFFHGLTEEKRKIFAPHVIRWLDLLEENRQAHYRPELLEQLAENDRLPNYHDLGQAGYAALLACGGISQIKAVRASYILPAYLRTVLDDRRPSWSQSYADHLCSHSFGWAGAYWLRVRGLVLAGICQAPTHENYILGGIEGVFDGPNGSGVGRFGPNPELVANRQALEAVVETHRDWFSGPFWRLFEIEGETQISLAARDRFARNKGGWTTFLVAIAGHPLFPRDRLLDASLAALNRGFLQFRAGWFSRFHEALKPSVDERLARIDGYLALLGANVQPSVTFALEALDLIDSRHPLATRKVLSALEPALRSRVKKIARQAITFLERFASREPVERRAVCLGATEALLSEHGDVQGRVLELLEKYGRPDDQELRARLVEFAPAIRSSLRPRLEKWLSVPLAREEAPPPSISGPVQGPRSAVDHGRAVAPITALDELFDRASAVLEAPDNISEIERVLDGIVRLGDMRTPHFERLAMPLAKRAVARMRRTSASVTYSPIIEEALGYLFVSWLGGRNYLEEFAASRARPYAGEPIGFLLRRLSAVADQAVRQITLPLLASPTHQGGWIEPAALVERWLAWEKAGVTPDRHEQVLALLRLAPEGRTDALPLARRAGGEAGRALRHALGERSPPGKDAALWLAAYRSLEPHGDLADFEQVHPSLGPGAGLAPRHTYDLLNLDFEPALPEESDPALLPVLINEPSTRLDWTWRSRPLLRWVATLWPANLDAFFAKAIAFLDTAVGWSEASDRESTGYLEPLIEPTVEMRPLACHALALGLAAKDSGLRSQAREALIAALGEERLPLDAFGSVLRAHFVHDPRRPARWARIFQEAAQVSIVHQAFLARLLPHALPTEPGPASKGVGDFLDAMLEIMSAAGVRIDLASARAYLGGVKGTGRTPKLARALLAL